MKEKDRQEILGMLRKKSLKPMQLSAGDKPKAGLKWLEYPDFLKVSEVRRVSGTWNKRTIEIERKTA